MIRKFTWLVTRATAVLLLAALPLAGALSRDLIAPGGGTIRGFVLGIDAYRRVNPLRGAVADARDIETSLRKGGVTDLTLLVDGDATRKQVLSQLDQLVARTRRGDLVVLTLAGHGSREPERVKGSKRDGYDEVFLLAGFDTVAPGSGERIFGDEFRAVLSRLEKAGADVVYLADACHGEGLIRSWDRRGPEPSYRQARYAITEDALAPLDLPVEAPDALPFERVTFLAAVDAQSKSPEVVVPGESGLRGALSYAFARALEGQAAPGGETRRRDLFPFLRQQVYQLSDQRQKPVLLAPAARDGADPIIFASRSTGPVAGETKPDDAVRVAILQPDGAPRPSLSPGKVALAWTAPDQADLVFDARTGDVLARGDLIRQSATAADLPALAERTRAVAALKTISGLTSQDVSLRPNDGLHRKGERVQVAVGDLEGRDLLLFNIASDGTVQLLWPDPARGESARVGRPSVSLPVEITPPYGADVVVAVTAPSALAELQAAIMARNGTQAAIDLPGLVAGAGRRAPGLRLGFTGLYTAP